MRRNLSQILCFFFLPATLDHETNFGLWQCCHHNSGNLYNQQNNHMITYVLKVAESEHPVVPDLTDDLIADLIFGSED
ncbi:hypothetical protein DFH27DRAFT_550717 [Peziza echinospora]|nr:hypothetical protein DFH27DRAFT_550717 [Peziza echinospora]